MGKLVLKTNPKVNEDTIEYKNSSGRVFHNRVQDVIFHVANHSTYHRGQMAAEFKQSGLNPLVTDFIVYKR